MMTHTRLKTLLLVALLTLPWARVAASADLAGRVALPSGSGPAVVFLMGVPDGTPPDRDTEITHRDGGAFDPPVSLGFVGNDFVLRSDDDRMHTTHLYLQLAYQARVSGRPLKNGATVYNIAQPIKGQEVRRPIRPYHQFTTDTGYIAVRCNPHSREQAAVLVFDHPYAAVTGADGSFRIANVPAGTREVWVWHDGHASMWRSVQVGATGVTEIAVEVPGP